MKSYANLSIVVAFVGFAIAYFISEGAGKAVMLIAFLAFIVFSILNGMKELKQSELGLNRFSSITTHVGFAIAALPIIALHVFGYEAPNTIYLGGSIMLIGALVLPFLASR